MKRKAISAIFVAVMLLLTPAGNAAPPEHNLKVGDEFLHDFEEFMSVNKVNGTSYEQPLSDDIKALIGQKEVQTTVHSIVTKGDDYQVNTTHKKGDVSVPGSTYIDEWQSIVGFGFLVVLLYSLFLPEAGDFDEPSVENDTVTEISIPLFATSDENAYLDYVKDINEFKEELENNTDTTSPPYEVKANNISVDSNVNTADNTFSFNIDMMFNTTNNATDPVSWKQDLIFRLSVVVDYNRSLVTEFFYEVYVFRQYQSATSLLHTSYGFRESKQGGGFLENFGIEVGLPPFVYFILASVATGMLAISRKRKSL